jgi:hypothetical protein
MVQTVPEDVTSYLDAVRRHLGDLPQQERDDLLADVESSLVESAEEGESPIAARLGPPESFADELRAAAGLVAENGAAAPLEPTLLDRLAEHYRRLDPRVMRVARELAPIWWVTRAYVAVAALALLVQQNDYRTLWSTSHPAIPTWGLGKAAVVLLALAAIVSCGLGLRARSAGSRTRGALVVVNVALVLAAVPVWHHLTEPSPSSRIIAALSWRVDNPVPAPAGLTLDGRPIANIYPYSRDGRLLLDVLLYDGAGRPIDLRPNSIDPNRRVLVTTRGATVYNSFPVRYYEPGTRKIADPAAGPKPGRPSFVTPAIRGVTIR